MKPCSGRQGEEIDASGGDVLAHRARLNLEARVAQFIEQFSVQQMHLPQVRCRRVTRDARAVFHRRARMRVALDAKPGDEANNELVRLAEAVF